MPLSESVLAIEDDFKFLNAAADPIIAHAEALTGSEFDPELWRVLAPPDFHLAMLVHFLGTLDNSGSLVNETEV